MDRYDAITALINATADSADMDEVVRALLALDVDLGELEDVDPHDGGAFSAALTGAYEGEPYEGKPASAPSVVNVAPAGAVVGIQCGGSVHGSTVNVSRGQR
jgi:hypothetical protein